MLRSWLHLALRYTVREWHYSVLNVVGLAVGLTAGTLVLGLLDADLHFDDSLEAKDRLFRLLAPGSTLAERGEAIRGVPAVEEATRVWMPLGRAPEVRGGGAAFTEPRRLFVDSTFLDLFGFPLQAGDRRTALTSPDAVVLTAAAARRYFGDADPVGQTLDLEDTHRTHTVTAVLRDLPADSHLQLSMLVPISAMPSLPDHEPATTYLRLRSPADKAAVEVALARTLLAGRASSADVPTTGPVLEPVSRVPLSSHGNRLGPSRSWHDLILYASVAGLLLLIACGNYVNLSLARSVRRLQEVGIRKALGAGRLAVVGQHLSESLLSVGLALAVSVGLAEVSRPSFEAALARPVAIDYGQHVLWLQLLGLGLVVALLAGGYPAVAHARRRAVWALAGKGGGGGAPRLRGALVLVQFTMAIGVLAMAGVTHLQLDYLRTKDLGFDTQDIVVVDARGLLRRLYEGLERSDTHLDLRIAKDTLRRDSQVEGVTLTGGVPGNPFYPRWGFQVPGRDRPAVAMQTMFVDQDYLRTLGLEMSSGRWFAGDFADEDDGLVLNETAARELGVDVGDAVTARLDILGQTTVPVIGIVKDSHYRSLHQRIPPMAFRPHPDPNKVSYLSHMVVRGAPGSGPKLAEVVRQVVAQLAPGGPVEVQFLDHVFAWEVLYEKEARMARVLGGFSLLGVGVACLGLLGLAAYAAEARRREVAIRKVLGASATEIVLWLSKGYVRLVVVASAVACPPAFLAARHWLQAFPYRIDLGAGVFVVAALAVMALAAATASAQALRASHVDPATALRHE